MSHEFHMTKSYVLVLVACFIRKHPVGAITRYPLSIERKDSKSWPYRFTGYPRVSRVAAASSHSAAEGELHPLPAQSAPESKVTSASPPGEYGGGDGGDGGGGAGCVMPGGDGGGCGDGGGAVHLHTHPNRTAVYESGALSHLYWPR